MPGRVPALRSLREVFLHFLHCLHVEKLLKEMLMDRRMTFLVSAGTLAVASAAALSGQSASPKTEITKWQDGKAAAVAITYDDSTINQFRVALPLMNERKLVGTFFVITGQIPGSKN